MEICKPVVSCVCLPSTAGYVCIVLACSVPKSLTTMYHFY